MCKDLELALQGAKNNIGSVASRIGALKVPCNYKAAFMKMADFRGFRFTDATFEQMESIGETKSKICLPLLEGKKSGLVVAFTLATRLDSDKARAMALQELEENSLKPTELNILKAILTIKERLNK